MPQVSETVLKYVIDGIEGTPAVLSVVLASLAENDSRWDARPDPDRFTLREMIAHLSDWDPIFVSRVERMRDETDPFLESVDEEALCQTNCYADQNPWVNFDRLKNSRPILVALMRALPAEAWGRTGNREFVGEIDLFHLATMILGHDSYHIRQVAEFLAA